MRQKIGGLNNFFKMFFCRHGLIGLFFVTPKKYFYLTLTFIFNLTFHFFKVKFFIEQHPISLQPLKALVLNFLWIIPRVQGPYWPGKVFASFLGSFPPEKFAKKWSASWSKDLSGLILRHLVELYYSSGERTFFRSIRDARKIEAVGGPQKFLIGSKKKFSQFLFVRFGLIGTLVVTPK